MAQISLRIVVRILGVGLALGMVLFSAVSSYGGAPEHMRISAVALTTFPWFLLVVAILFVTKAPPSMQPADVTWSPRRRPADVVRRAASFGLPFVAVFAVARHLASDAVALAIASVAVGVNVLAAGLALRRAARETGAARSMDMVEAAVAVPGALLTLGLIVYLVFR
ncbi:hypothetical protein FDZ71_00225 [bacterium]|nr:MAG: hypothetical protein FDZ71_00225 [bacterium]